MFHPRFLRAVRLCMADCSFSLVNLFGSGRPLFCKLAADQQGGTDPNRDSGSRLERVERSLGIKIVFDHMALVTSALLKPCVA